MTQIRLSMIKEVAHGIKGFFDAFIGTQLLYNNERVSELTEILFESILRSKVSASTFNTSYYQCYIHFTGAIP